jgi:hypothetical protein
MGKLTTCNKGISINSTTASNAKSLYAKCYCIFVQIEKYKNALERMTIVNKISRKIISTKLFVEQPLQKSKAPDLALYKSQFLVLASRNLGVALKGDKQTAKTDLSYQFQIIWHLFFIQRYRSTSPQLPCYASFSDQSSSLPTGRLRS